MHFGTPVVPDENMMYSGAENGRRTKSQNGVGCANNVIKGARSGRQHRTGRRVRDGS